jgi:glycosyltransferase involved in cell wall biosynthesis
MPTVGVVIPLYRCAPYVRGCLESVLAQTRPIDEIVLVDDRGDDDSVGIATATLDGQGRSYILLTQPHNKGLGAARNTGLAALATDLVWFLDSDDQVDAEFVETLVDALEAADADFAVTRTRRVDEAGNTLQIDEEHVRAPVVTGTHYARELISGGAKGYACTKMFRREVLGARPWAEGQAYEDIGTSVRIALSSRRVAMVDRPLYHYLYREGSISTTLSPATLDLFTVEDDIRKLLCESSLEHDWRREFTGFRYREVLTSVAHLAMRDQHAQGTRSGLQHTAISQVRTRIALRDIPILWQGRHYREMVFAGLVKYLPGMYSAILRRR